MAAKPTDVFAYAGFHHLYMDMQLSAAFLARCFFLIYNCNNKLICFLSINQMITQLFLRKGLRFPNMHPIASFICYQ